MILQFSRLKEGEDQVKEMKDVKGKVLEKEEDIIISSDCSLLHTHHSHRLDPQAGRSLGNQRAL